MKKTIAILLIALLTLAAASAADDGPAHGQGLQTDRMPV